MDTRFGTLHECATDWYKKYGNGETIRLLKEFTNVSDTTVTRWFVADMWPNGINAINLMVFVQLFGYDVTEANKIGADIKSINRALAFGVLTLKELQKLLGVRVDSVIRIMHGRAYTTPKRVAVLRRYIKEHQETIDASEKSWREKIQQFLNPRRDFLPAPLPAVPRTPVDAVVDNTQVATFNTILSITNSLSDIAQMHIDSAQLSDSQKLNFALATSHLCKLLGIRSETLSQLLQQRQQQTTADLGEFQSLLKIGGR